MLYEILVKVLAALAVVALTLLGTVLYVWWRDARNFRRLMVAWKRKDDLR